MFRTTGVNVSISMTNSVVSEEDMSVELCVNVVGLLDKIINITVDSDDGRAIGKSTPLCAEILHMRIKH